MTTKFEPRIGEKRWDHSTEETKLLELWEREAPGAFRRDQIRKKPTIAIDVPPPYASGKWHVGGAAHYVHHDILIRYLRMRGYNVLAPFYADRNGLPVEVYIERTRGINPHELASTREGREKFLELCKEQLDKTERELVKIWKKLGCSFEYWQEGTDSSLYRRLTQQTFIELWKRGLIYLAEKPVSWCPRCRTSLSEAEIEYREEQGRLYFLNFELLRGGKVTVATTRPELLAACRALIYNPNDLRYSGLRGEKARVPLYDHLVSIFEHPYASPTIGTGLMMVCSYGDQADVRLFRELGLEPVALIREDGTLSERAGRLAGLSVVEARRKIVEILEEIGALQRAEDYKHTIPTCWRCGTRVEYIQRREYFLRQLDFKEDLLKIVENIKFFPEFHKRKLIDWINSLSMDWPISRDRYYATEIPAWKCSRCNEILVPEKLDEYCRPWRDPPPWEFCPKCGAPREELVGEKKVFDTWFDSSISCLYVTGYQRDLELYEAVKDSTVRVQGYDIIRTWLYFSLLRVYLLTGRPAFSYVRITGMGLDERGEAMHKSKGNVINPEPVLEEYGADAFRFWAAISTKIGYDYRFSPQQLRAGKLFVTKLWNIARFISSFPEPAAEARSTLVDLDRALLSKLNSVARAYVKYFDEELDHFEATLVTYNFVWNVFASHYLEAVKDRAYNRTGDWSTSEQLSAWATLHETLRGILKLLAPIMPFITDAIWRRLYGPKSIHEETLDLPRPEWDSWDSRLLDLLVTINGEVWRYKRKRGLTPRQPVADVLFYVPSEAEPLVKHLEKLHAAKFEVGEPPLYAEKLGTVSVVELRQR
ncbi:MAG: valine--tRNA ligase [Fervidicoccaceae archaeon]